MPPPQYQPNIIWILLLLFTLSTTNLMAQTLVNKDWATPSVHPLVLDWYSSTVDASGQVINVGNTTVSGQGTDIAIQKVDNDGNVVWQRIYNSSNNQNDVGIAVTTDFDDNIYICGMTNVNNQQDVLVVKYNRDGVFQWVNQYNNAANGNDVATTLKTDTWGNVYVAAVSETPTTASDFLLLKLNTNGVLLWQKRYDYAGLFEIPAALAFDNNNNVLIVGASASDFTNWDYTIVKYTPEGILQNVVRNNAAGAGFDQPVAAKRDPSGNFYVVGKASSDGVNYNIKTVKFNPDLSLAWVRTYDASGREDAAKDLAIDDDGNVVVAGYSTKSNGLKEITLIKYNTDGNTEWIHKQAAKDDSGDAIAKSLDIDDDGKVYFLAEEKGTANSKDVVAMKLNTNGAVEWSQHLNTSADETPTHIAVDADGHILVSEIVGTVYQTVRYSEYVPNNAVIRDSANRAVAMQYQVIVRFNENAVNRDAVDGNIGSAESVFGDLEYFLQPNAAQAVRTKLSGQCNTITSINNACPLKLSKVFPLLRTTDTTTISRMGEVIPIPTFWATFVLHLPEGANLQRAMDSLNTLFPTVFFCHANQIGYPTSVPNDHFYNTGGLADLRPTSLYPNGHVNVEPAWDIETGKEHVKVGVFDTGLQWQHEDFGYDGVNPNSSRVVDGWDFDRNSFLKLLPHVEGLNHGTPVAGIIGAVRNNNIGIPGIAGGDAQVGKKGVSLYGLKIYDSGGTDNNLPMSTIANAIVTSTIEPNRIRFRPYSYGLHIMNHSWLVGGVRPGSTPISPTNVKLLEDAVHFVNRAKVTFVNCRGNEGRDDVGDRAYPALFNDDWLICVGGTGTNGLYSTSALPNRNSSNTSSYGKTVDIAGPTSELLIDGALREGGTARNIYSNFLGTSAATPHAAGAAALLMSYLNEPVPDYKNLAPEDVEEILQKSATDVGDEGRDDYTGFGRLNIGRALQSVRKPCWQLNHYGTSTTAFSNQITQFPSQIATLSQNYTNNDGIVFAANQPYEVVPIKIEATMNHNLPITADIHAFWARSSSSNLLKALEPQVGGLPSKLEPIEKVVIKPNTVNRNQLRIEGYIYEVRDMSNNFIGWIPKDLRPVNSFQLEYTLLIRDNRFCQDRVTTQDVITIENVTLYPNPTQGLQTLRINLAVSTQLSITLCDVTGKVLKQVFNGESTNGENDYACDFKDLPNGFYVYRIQTNEVVRYVKTVKN